MEGSVGACHLELMSQKHRRQQALGLVSNVGGTLSDIFHCSFPCIIALLISSFYCRCELKIFIPQIPLMMVWYVVYSDSWPLVLGSACVFNTEHM